MTMKNLDNIKAAIAVIKHPTKELFLASERKDKPNDFGFVGGKLNDNENALDAAIRETLEESGFNLKIWAFSGKELYIGPDETGIIVAAFSFQLNNGNIPMDIFSEIVEHIVSINSGDTNCKWATKDELCSGTFSKYNKTIFSLLEVTL